MFILHKIFSLIAITAVVAGCAAPLTTYVPTKGQAVEFNQGVGTVTVQATDATLMMYPTFRYQSPGDIPTFTLMIQNTSSHDIDFDPETLTATLDAHECHVYSMEERVQEIRRSATRKKIALAIAGGLAAGAVGYAASHQTTTYTSVGYVGRHNFYSSGTIQTYDPASGIFAGAAVGAATGVGIHQIAKSAGFQEQAAQGIFQRTTIHPGTTVVGQIELKAHSAHFALVNVDVPVSGFPTELQFQRKDSL
jgi:hypothetical protein